MPRPSLLGIVGDSAAGKTTLTRGLVRILGADRVTHIDGDHYHRCTRAQRAEAGITPLHPDANHLDILEQHLIHLRGGEPILKPVYRHRDGTLAPSEYVTPAQFTIVEGMLGFHTPAMRDTYDVRIFLDPPEDLRRRWKVQRDCSRRGYSTDEVLAELDRREADAETFIRPQHRCADIVISFMPGDRGDPAHLDVRVR
jgi:phosphoribulokinase